MNIDGSDYIESIQFNQIYLLVEYGLSHCNPIDNSDRIIGAYYSLENARRDMKPNMKIIGPINVNDTLINIMPNNTRHRHTNIDRDREPCAMPNINFNDGNYTKYI